jgi:cytochrome c-type biogenesis protein CcmH/NrfF
MNTLKQALALSALAGLLFTHLQLWAAEKVDDDAVARYTTLIKETRCVVCQGQNLADSAAPLAQDLRKKIYTLILNHQTDEEIKNYLVQRYGEFILLRPTWHPATWLLWLFPWIALSCISWFIIAK